MMKPEILDQLPPQDLDAEKGVLGSIILKQDVCEDVAPILAAEDFYADANQKLFGHLVAMHDEGKRIDATLLKDRLTKAGDLEAVGGMAYLAELMQSTPVAAHAEFYAGIVVEKAKRRRLRTAGEDLIRASHSDEPPSEIAAKTADQLTEIGAGGHVTDVLDATSVVADLLIDLEKPDRSMGIPTGFAGYDQPIGGLYDGELIVLAARPKTGKTSLGLNITANVATRGRDVLFVSLEQPARELAARLLTSRAGINGNDLRTGTLTDEDKAALAQAANDLPLDRLHLTDRPGTTVADIRWTARRLQRQGKLDLIVVDYLQRLIPADPRARRHEQIGQMSRDLKRLALELNVPVLCLAQLNRQTEGKGEHIPQLHQLKGSGDIEQDADVVILLHREELYSKNRDDFGKADLFVAKNRSGPEADIKLEWDGATTTFSDPSVEWDADRGF